MKSVQLTPILIIGFNRPSTLSSLLSKVETLGSRRIVISLDGSRSKSDELKVFATYEVAKTWAKSSHHEVNVIKRNDNFGIYKHCTQALSEFFLDFEVGIILEDDIDFRQEFVSYVDQHQVDLICNNYWSICGHNPSHHSNHDHSKTPIVMKETYVHTIWGWATGRASVQKYLDFLNNPREEVITKAIDDISRSITRDPFLRLGIVSTWRRKITRAFESSNNSGWDNFWLIAGWSSGLFSLLPCCSLSTEVQKFDEGQTHPHQVELSPLIGLSAELTLCESTIKYKIGSDITLLKVWGISRLYCWVFFLRLTGRR